MNKKKTILTIIIIFVVLLVAGASIYVATQLSTRQAVAPTAPESEPAAAEPTTEWVSSEACSVIALASETDCVPSGVVTCSPDCPTACGKAASTISTCTNSCGDAVTKECSATAACTVTVTTTAAPVVTSVPTAVKTVAPTAVVTEVVATPTILPETGILDLPGVAAFGGGLVLAVVGILLAL